MRKMNLKEGEDNKAGFKMGLMLSKKVILFGLCFALVLSIGMTSDVKADDTQTICKQVVEATAKELGSTSDFSGAWKGGWWYEDLETGLNIRIEAFHTVDAAKAQWNKPPIACGPEGQRLSRTPDNFHGYRATRWDGMSCSWSENETGAVWGYKEFGELFSWKQGRFILSIGYAGSEWDAPKSRSTVKKHAEVLYANAEGSGLFEPISATGAVSMVKVKYPGGTEEVYREYTTIEITKGMIFEALDPDKSMISLPTKFLYKWDKIEITNLETTDEGFELAYAVKSKGDSIVSSINNIEPLDSGTIQMSPADMACLEAVYGFGEFIVVTRTKVYTTTVIKEIAQKAVVIVLSGSPVGPAVAVADNLDDAMKIFRFLCWHTVRYPALPAAADYYVGPRNTRGAIVTPAGAVYHNSDGIIEITDDKTKVYVFEGEFQLSDPDQTKTVSVHSGQTSTCERGGVPSEPEAFDQNSIDTWWKPKAKFQVDVCDFNDGPAQNWTDDGSGCWAVSEGVYAMTGNKKGEANRYSHYDPEYCDFAFAADVRKIAGDSNDRLSAYGLWIRSDGTENNHYMFAIVVDGRYMIAKRVGGVFTEMIDMTTSDALKTGYNEWNTLKVVAQDSTLQFYANDVLLETKKDTSLSCGKVGLFAVDSADSDSSDTVQFDNVLILKTAE